MDPEYDAHVRVGLEIDRNPKDTTYPPDPDNPPRTLTYRVKPSSGGVVQAVKWRGKMADIKCFLPWEGLVEPMYFDRVEGLTLTIAASKYRSVTIKPGDWVVKDANGHVFGVEAIRAVGLFEEL